MAKTIVFTLKFSDNITCVLLTTLPCVSIKVLLRLTLRLTCDPLFKLGNKAIFLFHDHAVNLVEKSIKMQRNPC